MFMRLNESCKILGFMCKLKLNFKFVDLNLILMLNKFRCKGVWKVGKFCNCGIC